MCAGGFTRPYLRRSARRGRLAASPLHGAETPSALSAGANDLIRQGATPLLDAGDVLESLGIEEPAPAAPRSLSPSAGRLLAAARDGPRGADELGAAAGLESAATAAAIVELELAGLLACADGVYRCTEPGTRLVSLKEERSPDAPSPA